MRGAAASWTPTLRVLRYPRPWRGWLALWLAAVAAPVVAAPPPGPQCTLSTKSIPDCALSLQLLQQGPFDATITLPPGRLVARTATSPGTYGSGACPERFLIRIEGDVRWTRLAVRPAKGPGSKPGQAECDCQNYEASMQVLALSVINHCEGGCKHCTIAELCAGNTHCECSFTPTPLNSYPVESRRATGKWVPASPLGGPAHCELEIDLFRNNADRPWKGAGGIVAAVVYDKRTRAKVPVIIEARHSEGDPGLAFGGCPHCPG